MKNTKGYGRERDDISGEVFGHLTAQCYTDKKTHGRTIWSCSCSCGRICEKDISSLRSGAITSCGCKGKTDVNSKRFGRLIAQWPEGLKLEGEQPRIVWLCSCDCGKLTHAGEVKLRGGRKQSCGC